MPQQVLGGSAESMIILYNKRARLSDSGWTPYCLDHIVLITDAQPRVGLTASNKVIGIFCRRKKGWKEGREGRRKGGKKRPHLYDSVFYK